MSFVGFIAGAKDDQQKLYRRAIRAAVKQTYTAKAEDIMWLVEENGQQGWDFDDRPMLMKAIKHARAGDLVFCIASLKGFAPRQWQGMSFLKSQVELYNLEILVADEPTLTGNSISFLALAAEAQRERMVTRSQAALQSIKEIIDKEGKYVTKKGRTVTKLGRHDAAEEASRIGAAVGSERARKREEDVWPIIKDCRDRGMNYSQTARHLTNMGLPTPSEMGRHKRETKGMWHPKTVRAICLRRE